ncbi:MAG: DUF4835 family protein [Ignavibacteriaceae bacterium]|nr:DUF4835 family protein [Ignavibacteriaceae bacterium]
MKYLLLIFILYTSVGLTQELNCKVTVNMEKLQSAAKDPLVGFQKTVEDYLDKTKFTQVIWEGGKIECSMNILFQTADNPNYTAQVIVSSQRPLYHSSQNSLMLNVNDGSWRFTYQKDQPLNSNQSIYDPITSFLDYYAFVIIGLDADSYDKLGGTRYFSKALDLVNLGSTSAFSDGWQNSSASYSRRGLVEDLMSEKYRSFREAFYEYHYNGLDIFNWNQTIAIKNMAKLVTAIDNIRAKSDINTVLMKVFFDSKNGELAESFKVYPNRDIYKTLKKIDPAHAKKYDDAMFGE